MDGLIPWFQLMVHAIPHKPSPVWCSFTMWIILPALYITHRQMVLLRSMFRLSRACSAKLKNKAKSFTSVLWSITIPILQVVCDHLCRFSKAGMLDLTCQYQMPARKQLGIQSEVINNSDKDAALSTHGSKCRSTYECFKIPQANIGNQLWLKVCVLNQEVTRWPQVIVLLTGNTISSEAFYTSELELINFSVCATTNGHNITICSQ